MPAAPTDTVRGVADTGGVAGPSPTALWALTRNWYAVPLDRPDTVNVVAVDTPSTTVTHVVPFVDCSIT